MKNLYLILAGLWVVIGLALFTRGVYLAWRPGGWMVAGLFVFAPSFFVLYGKARE